MNIMKKEVITLLLSLILLIVLSSHSSESPQTYLDKDGIKITYTKQQSKINANKVFEYIILRIENTNSYGVNMSWKLDLWYNEVCRTCNQPSPTGYEFELDLKGGEHIEGSVKEEDLMLKIYSRTIKPEGELSLTNFEFTDLKVSKN